MEAVPIPPDLVAPGCRIVSFGPPQGVSEEYVYTHEAIVGPWHGGPMDGASSITVLIRLEDGDLERLMSTGHLWMTLLSKHLPPWMVYPAEVDPPDEVIG